MTADGSCTAKIKRQIDIAKSAFKKRVHVFTISNLTMNTRNRAAKTYVWSTLHYDSGAWTMSKELERRLEAMEMWCWKTMLKVKWTEPGRIEDILETDGSR